MRRTLLFIASLIVLLGIAYAIAVTQTSPSLTWAKGSSISVEKNFTITNTWDTAISNIFFTTTNLTYASNLLNASIAISPNGTTLSAGQTKGITITLTNIPDSQQLGTYTGILTSHYNGNTTNSTISISVEDADNDITVPASLSFTNSKRGRNYGKVFAVQNTGNTVLNDVIIGSTLSASFSPVLNTTTFTLQPQQSRSVLLNITIPSGESYGNKSLGTLSFTSDEAAFSDTIAVSADVASNLKISDVDVTIGSSSQKSAEEGETIDYDGKPGDRVVFDVRVENHFTSQEDTEIRDITVRATIAGVDEGEDLEEETDEFDLDADESDRVFITIDLPQDAEDSEFEVEVEANGEDEDGVVHTDTFTFSINVERKTHDIRITDANLASASAKCGESVNVNVGLLNVGRDDEDEVRLTISSQKLGINEVVTGIELDSDSEGDNTYDNTFTSTIPNDADEGTHKIDVKAYYSDDILDDAKTLTLTVSGCKAEEPVKNATKQVNATKPAVQTPKVNATITQPPQANATATPIAVTTSTESTFFDSGEYTILLVLGSAIVVLLIVIIIANLLPRRGSPY